MPSAVHVAILSAAALAFWGMIGFACSSRLLPTRLALAVAPALGWAVQNAVALPVYRVVGFESETVLAGSAVMLLAALPVLLWHTRAEAPEPQPYLVPVPYLFAALLAAVPTIALFPKILPDAITLAPPIFDHTKIAIIDEMTRLGLPPGNPFFGGAGDGPLAYYYLWHFSAAQLAVSFGASGWEADIAVTAFTAFATLALVIGLAMAIAGRVTAGLLAVLLAFAASLRPVLTMAFGWERLDAILRPPTGLESWLFQVTWAPQHVAAAGVVVVATIVLVGLARQPSPLAALLLGLLAAAGYESSTWVGGILFALAAPVIGVILLISCEPGHRLRFIGCAVLAGAIALTLSFPFLREQAANAASRGIGMPIALAPYGVFSGNLFGIERRLIDVPGFWLVLLVVELPAIYPAGLIALLGSLRKLAVPTLLRDLVIPFFALTLISLVCASMLVVTFAENNDLGWRSILPAILMLTAFAAAGLSNWLARGWRVATALTLVLVAAAVPDSIRLTDEFVFGYPTDASRVFPSTGSLWDAVRRHATPVERIANNPLFLEAMTPWPGNVSWALLSNRPSCFAGRDLTLPFVPMPHDAVVAIDDQFRRIFAGDGSAQDLHDLATRYDCRVVVLTAQDGAWAHDPFAPDAAFELAEQKNGEWKIYRIR